VSNNTNRFIARELEFWANKCFGENPPSYIATGILSNANDLYKLLLHIETHSEDCKAGEIEIELAIGDIVGLCQRLCNVLELDFCDIHFRGCQRLAQKSKEISEGDTSYDNDPRYAISVRKR
jgi:hypothetical protein